MKNFSLFYELMKLVVKPAMRLYYKVRITNRDYFPEKGPVLICGNHVNAFMDPISLQLNSRRQLFSLARGDVFEHPVLRRLLTALKLIPIYRLSEGAGNLKKNELTFTISEQVLSQGNALIIYPEAVCVQEKRVRKLKKGAARIAFETEEKNDFNSGLVILPVGHNYSNPQEFGSELLINFGKPIAVKNYQALYLEDKVRAMIRLTNDLELAMKELVIDIKRPENDLFVDQYTEMQVSLSEDADLERKFKRNSGFVRKVNSLTESGDAGFAILKEKTGVYYNELSKLDIKDGDLQTAGLKAGIGFRVLFEFFAVAFGMPFYALGLALNYPAYLLGSLAQYKLAKNIEFRASIRFTVGWFSWIGYYLLQLLAVGLLFRNWLLLAVYAAVVPLLLRYCIFFSGFLQQYLGRLKAFRLRKKDAQVFENLVGIRTDLLNFLKKELL